MPSPQQSPVPKDAYTNPLGFDTGLEPDPSVNKDFFERQLQEMFALNGAINRVAKTDDGKMLLSFLRKATIESATWMSSLGYEQAIAHGFAREGQNSLVRDLENRISLAEKCKTPDDLMDIMKGGQ